MLKHITLLMVLFFMPFNIFAVSIYKCVGADGDTVIKDKPCRGEEKRVPVLNGKGGSSVIGNERSAFSQLQALRSLKPRSQQMSGYGADQYANQPRYRSSTTRQSQLTWGEKQDLKNNRTRRSSLARDKGKHVDRQMRSLDRDDSAIRGREYVPDPEPLIIKNYYNHK